MEITQEMIDDAIKNCDWRKEVGEFSICRGEVLVCSHVINSGKCDALKKLFRGDKNE